MPKRDSLTSGLEKTRGRKAAPNSDEVFAALDAAGIPADFMREADRNRTPANEAPAPNPTHPGELVREYMGSTSVADFSRCHGFTSSELSELLDGRAPVTLSLAKKLADAFGTDPGFWTTLQRLYEDRCSPLRGLGQNWVTFERDEKGFVSESRKEQKVLHGSDPALWPPYIRYTVDKMREEGGTEGRVVWTVRVRDLEDSLLKNEIPLPSWSEVHGNASPQC